MKPRAERNWLNIMNDLETFRNNFQQLSKLDKADLLAKLSETAYVHARFFTDTLLRDNQIIEQGNWRYYLFVAGRGSGKTLTGAAEIRKRVYNKEPGLCVIASTHQELIKVIIPAIKKEFPDYHQPKYHAGDKQFIECHNGITIDCRTSQQGEIRGPNYTFVWLDELVKCWDGIPEKVETNFAILDASIRKGKAQILITTTGATWSIFKKWYDLYNSKSPLIKITTGKCSDNEYLSPQAVEALYLQYGNSRYASQELDGIINFEIDGALWTPQLINNTRKVSIEEVANPPNPNKMRNYHNPLDFFVKFAIGADPATTSNANSDSWGLIVAGLGRDHHLYIIEDKTKVLSPGDAANEIARLHHTYRNAQIIAESNQGGEMITYILRTKLPNIQPKLVHAHQNKMTRAQPVTVLWDQNRAHLVGNFPDLEKEMCEFTGDPSQQSPNRLDAMVYAAQWLILEPNLRVPQQTWMPKFS